MAKAQVTMPEDFLKKLSSLGSRTDEITEKVLKAGGEVALEAVKGRLGAVIGRGTKYPSRASGELLGSAGLSPVKVNGSGNHDIKVGFSEPHSGGINNAKLASILEYGKHGQPAKPFMKPAKAACKSTCEETMKRVFDEEVSKL